MTAISDFAASEERLTLLSGALVLSAGVRKFDQPMRVSASLPSGVKIVVLLSGRLQIAVGHGARRELCGPVAFVLRTPNGAERDQVYAADVPVRYVIVQMAEQLVSAEMAQAMTLGIGRGTPDKQAFLMSCPAGQALRALSTQITACPIRGVERELYLCGKAMQLAALAISSCLAQVGAVQTAQLSARDIDKLRRAREILVETMQQPPSLEGLAQQVGLNVRKLSNGFRRFYGATVFGFLQEYRLEQAYKLIASGEMSVSETAHHVGYGAAHFATIFRKRFGVSPSALR